MKKGDTVRLILYSEWDESSHLTTYSIMKEKSHMWSHLSGRSGRAARGRERHQAAADGDTEEGLQEPDRDGMQHIARDDDHRVRTASHVPTRTRKVQ